MELTEYHEYHGRSYEMTKYEPESEIDIQDFQLHEMKEFEERQLAIKNNLAMANNSCQSAKFFLLCANNPDDNCTEKTRRDMAFRSILVAIKMIQSLQELLDI